MAHYATRQNLVTWIAFNDNNGSPEALEIEAVKGYLTVKMAADCLGLSASTIAREVVAARLAEDARTTPGR